jgi:hypothetical protein
MNQFDAKKSRLKFDTNEGWMVQVYGRDRRLLWVLEPSHGWIFLMGCCVGLLLSVIWVNVARYSPPVEPTTTTESPAFQVD